MRLFPVILLLLMVTTACLPAQPTQTAVQATALAIVHTAIAQTQTAQPTNTPLSPTVTATATIVYPTPSPYPTEAPITFSITPDAIQIERWEEYQFALALELVQGHGIAFCEWEILGQSGNEVYVWAVCAAPGYEADKPVVIHLRSDGSIQGTDSPIMYTDKTEDEIKKLFPLEVQEKIASYGLYEIAEKYKSHIEWRRSHPEEPPLIIQSAVPFVTPTFTPASPPILTPNANQIERWREYQTALADAILIEYNYYSEDALCEWDILGRSGQKAYVWAYCSLPGGGGGNVPAVIYLGAGDSIQSVEVPQHSSATWDSQINRMFPLDVREKFTLYYSSTRQEEMRKHLLYRREHSEEPPLIVLSATP